MNHLAHVTTLTNRYVILRHGESEANRAGIIVSDPHVGIEQFGLTATGRQQVAATMAAQRILDPQAHIYSSDFKRARETAEIAREHLGVRAPLTLRSDLRERYFGSWEHTPNINYQRVWNDDRRDPAHTHGEVESVLAVLTRTTAFIDALETQWQGQTILVVSHGDVLQILATAFYNISPAMHRQLPPLRTAELRVLRYAPHPA